jgi:hypothetical protein
VSLKEFEQFDLSLNDLGLIEVTESTLAARITQLLHFYVNSFAGVPTIWAIWFLRPVRDTSIPYEFRHPSCHGTWVQSPDINIVPQRSSSGLDAPARS